MSAKPYKNWAELEDDDALHAMDSIYEARMKATIDMLRERLSVTDFIVRGRGVDLSPMDETILRANASVLEAWSKK